MMPSKKFDYKIVDFSAFQGGSQNIPNQVQFDQTMVRMYISFYYHLMNLYSNINLYFFRKRKNKKTEKRRSKRN